MNIGRDVIWGNGLDKIDMILRKHIVMSVDENLNVLHKEMTDGEYQKTFGATDGTVLPDCPERLTSNTIPTNDEAALMGEGWSIDADGDPFDPYDPDGFGKDD